MALLLGALIWFNTATEKGGLSQSWSSSLPIGLLVGFGTLLILLVLVEWWQGANAMLPSKVLNRRNISVCALYSFL